jgi:hypothetical protein
MSVLSKKKKEGDSQMARIRMHISMLNGPKLIAQDTDIEIFVILKQNGHA